jgi:hypothetical protein
VLLILKRKCLSINEELAYKKIRGFTNIPEVKLGKCPYSVGCKRVYQPRKTYVEAERAVSFLE